MYLFKKSRLFFLISFMAVFILPVSAQAKTNILFIVDGSNSMWGQIDNKAKMETAKTTLGKLVSDLPADANLALMAYGHTREKDCNDVELLSAIGKDSPEMITTLIHTIQPTGKTPIANALAKSKDAFKGLEGQNNHILLVSDGIESCDGDPCAVAKSLQEAGLDVSAHVIGFGVSKEEGKQLTCIAENTGGKYFDAADTAAFNEAIEEVTQIAQAEPEPEPAPAPEPTLWFEDNFDGEDLAEHWEVINPNPDSYIVENGKLMMVSSKLTGFNYTDMPNMITLNKELPQGDWDINVTFSGELGTGKEWLWLGLRKDERNFLSSLFYHKMPGYGPDNRFMLRTIKHSDGNETKTENTIWQPDWFELGHGGVIQKFINGPATLTLSKRGRGYSASFQIDGLNDENGSPYIRSTSTITSMRSPGELTLGMGLHENADGEFLALIDSIQIIEIK